MPEQSGIAYELSLLLDFIRNERIRIPDDSCGRILVEKQTYT